MCLHIDEKLDKSFREKRNNDTWVKLYKVYGLYDKKLYPVCRGSRHVKAGWIKSNRRNKNVSKGDKAVGIIEKGIHVFLNANSAFSFASRYCDRIVACKAKISDLVSCGKRDQAVFMKIFLSKKEYDRAIKV